MSDELKWWEIERAVWDRGPQEKAQRAVLAQLAKHSDAAGVTFVGQPKIAERSGFTLTTVKRAIAALEFAGWIRIEERAVLVETRRGFERKGNRYLLNLVKLGLIAAPKPKSQPVKSDADYSDFYSGSDEGGCPAAATSDVEGSGPVADARVEGVGPARNGRVGWARGAEESSSARSHFEVGEVSLEARRGVIGGAPLINIFEPEKYEQKELPYAPPGRGADVGNREEQRQRQRLPDESGAGNILAFPKRQRATRELRSALYESVRSTLDGEEAALWDETTRVLEACGVVPEHAGRKLREAISLALRQEWRRGDEPLAAVADRAIEMWKLYVGLGLKLRVRCGLMGFFKSGEWLHSGRWRYDKEEIDWQRHKGL